MSTMYAIIDFYDNILVQKGDPRVGNWPLMSSPLMLPAIIAVYLYIVYKALPNYMVGRRPYNLKPAIAIYNVLQVLGCMLVIYGLTTSGWTTHYTFGCELADYSEDKLAMRMAKYMWWMLIIKLAEFIETFFFLLRKKYNQVSVLHVYHHSSAFAVCWLAVKYHAGGMITFTAIINAFVHVIMYSYYFLSVFGPEMRKKLEPLKPKLTVIQMIQLCIILVYNSQILLPSCRANKLVAYIVMPVVLINLGLFYNFYKRNYGENKVK